MKAVGALLGLAARVTYTPQHGGDIGGILEEWEP
jgi:hypothetical protein